MRILAPSCIALVAASALLGSACNRSKSQQCNDVCQLETDCAEERSSDGEQYPYDLDECIAACEALEGDSNSQGHVKAHFECAEKAGGDCTKLLECRI